MQVLRRACVDSSRSPPAINTTTAHTQRGSRALPVPSSSRAADGSGSRLPGRSRRPAPVITTDRHRPATQTSRFNPSHHAANSAMSHSLQFALNRALLKIFGALSKDTYKDIRKDFVIRHVDEQISARQRKFYLRYCASEN